MPRREGRLSCACAAPEVANFLELCQSCEASEFCQKSSHRRRVYGYEAKYRIASVLCISPTCSSTYLFRQEVTLVPFRDTFGCSRRQSLSAGSSLPRCATSQLCTAAVLPWLGTGTWEAQSAELRYMNPKKHRHHPLFKDHHLFWGRGRAPGSLETGFPNRARRQRCQGGGGPVGAQTREAALL